MRRNLLILNLLLVLALVLFAGTALAQNPVQQAAESYFSGGIKFIKAEDLYANLNDGDPENDPYIISVRSAEDYAKGHIPGAVNFSPKTILEPENLAKLPKDKQIVVVCYTGQSACHVTAVLNMLGYDAYALLFGMSSWTTDPNVYVKRFNPEKHAHDYPVETKANEATETYDLPTPLGDTVEAAAKAYLSGGPKFITAEDLYANLNDGDPENDPFIISVRSAEDYAKGHIPGTVHFDPKELFKVEYLKKLPPDKQIVVVCYTGQAASQVTAALNMLGYDAYTLKFGMGAWTNDPNVYVKRFNPEKHAHDYPVEKAQVTMPVTGEAAGIPVAPVALIVFGGISVATGLAGWFVSRRKAA